MSKYFIILILWKILFLTIIQCSDELICAKASPKDEFTHQTVNCKFTNLTYSNYEIYYQCTIYVDRELKSSNSQNVVQVEFSLLGFTEKMKTVTFYWISYLKHSLVATEPHLVEEQFKHNRTVGLSINSNNESTAEIILYKLHYDTVYKVCVNMNETFDQKVCCMVENLEEKEESNIYMVLVVLGVLLLIYAFVIIATKITNKKEKTIDELLETLPMAHVERLKSLFEINEDEDEISDYSWEDETEEEKPYEPISTIKKTKNGKKVTIIDNFGYELDTDETIKNDETEDIQLNLYKEAQKFRKMSRKISIAAISTEDSEKIKPKRTKNVKFNQNLPGINGINNIKLKVYNESNRRASIKPYKKPYDLGASDSD